MKLDHIAFYVTDIDKCADFLIKHYKGKKSETVTDKFNESSCYVSFDKGARIKLLHRDDINEPTLQMHPGLNYHHTAISVGSSENYDKVIEGLLDDGYIFLTGPRVNSFGGKEGIVIGEGGNITVQTSPGMGDEEVVNLNHIGFFIDDNKIGAKFLVDYFGGEDHGCSKINRKTGQDNYMIGFEGCDVELMTCPNMIPEIPDRYQKLGYAYFTLIADNKEQYDSVLAKLLNDHYQALLGPLNTEQGDEECIIKGLGNIAIKLVCKK